MMLWKRYQVSALPYVYLMGQERGGGGIKDQSRTHLAAALSGERVTLLSHAGAAMAS